MWRASSAITARCGDIDGRCRTRKASRGSPVRRRSGDEDDAARLALLSGGCHRALRFGSRPLMAGRGRLRVPTFKAIVITKTDTGTAAALTDFDENDLMEGNVTLRPEWSTVNYKDGLAVTGKAPVVRRFPMIAGIDGAGTVEASSHPDWKPGDKVVLNGWGCGETHLGCYAHKARVKGDWLVPLP